MVQLQQLKTVAIRSADGGSSGLSSKPEIRLLEAVRNGREEVLELL